MLLLRLLLLLLLPLLLLLSEDAASEHNTIIMLHGSRLFLQDAAFSRSMVLLLVEDPGPDELIWSRSSKILASTPVVPGLQSAIITTKGRTPFRRKNERVQSAFITTDGRGSDKLSTIRIHIPLHLSRTDPYQKCCHPPLYHFRFHTFKKSDEQNNWSRLEPRTSNVELSLAWYYSTTHQKPLKK